ncbi:cytochrome c-type biogenesis protein [Sphingomonas qomolangmaensis]|uniref:Cytochrome c-type biogenesis protein n=1 Tax=Sphingomonas qomolangmaensis TaxID=2918765 RepID=A0ABY5LAY8_9SPHN|nr:cytochrome c-type biogenesis protein [Sphingomonas qomolangmaensis]UUL83042.1 cytochrome c-type biogenesis protein CcmH [Sphingomonas qomolangmaensis]
MRQFAILALLVAAPLAAQQSAVPQAELAWKQLPDPAKEAEARELMEELRCLVCQGQSIADSDADMAGDMRALVRERVGQGESAADVRAWLIERYGDYVSYDPPVSGASVPLWIAPIVLLILGAGIAARSFRRRSR